ncbi:kinase-like protein [Athelia psychrophila]|uniref:Kinase-like protein n=1 Tax=Athelia psychrophila TaxID=1759441 RepID=A0A166FM52_9AGAM|nr:kinase-like protein [Fibularhizoctonia sp. CBS 109695]
MAPPRSRIDESDEDITSRVELRRHRENQLGEGSFGQVYRAWYTQRGGEKILASNVQVAVKVVMCTALNKKKVKERLMREIITWNRVSKKEEVADFMGIYQVPNEPPYLVMPYYKNNKLLHYLATRQPHERLARQSTRGLIHAVQAKEITRGLDLLHGNRVIHGDLKPENILVSDAGCAQIADFGFALIPELEGFTTFADRNVRHSAPELLPLSNVDIATKPTRQSDIYSLGILLLQIFDGRVDCLPYEHVPISNRDPTESALLSRIHDGERPKRRSHPNISDSMWSVIAACWVGIPSARPSIQEVRSWLNLEVELGPRTSGQIMHAH